MENVKAFFENVWGMRLVSSLVTIILSLVIYKTLIYFLEKGEKTDNVKIFTSKKSKTYFKLVRSVTRYIFVIITVFILLQQNGIDISSVLAGVGILGVVFGLAIQDWLKDIIRGSSILSDDYFSVGDVVKYKDMEGKVLVIGLKTTKIQDIKTSNIVSIANRNIEEVELVSNMIYINVPMPYEIDVKKAERVVMNMVESIKGNEHVEEVKYLGVNELADSSINYLISIQNNNPSRKLQIRRDALRVVLVEMEKNGISVPYTQIDIHEK